MWLLRLVRRTGFLIAVCASLLVSTVSLGLWAALLTTQVATLTAGAAATAIANRKALTTAAATAKRKSAALVARHKRTMRTVAKRNRKRLATAIARTRAKMAVERKKAVAKAVVRTKAKGRLRRAVVAVPLLGLAAAAAFEHSDFKVWQADNPEGDLAAYGCDVATNSAIVIDDVLQELPESVRPSRNLVLAQLPTCEKPQAVALSE
ncbi:MAG: hypothetical protein AAF468_16670 [Pseudomonadota bacterium]